MGQQKNSQDHAIFIIILTMCISSIVDLEPQMFFVFFYVNAFSRSALCLQAAKVTVQIDDSKHAVKAAQKLLKREKCQTF